MTYLSLVMFGSFQARIDGQPISGFECMKTRALLAYLADEPGRLHWRSALSGLLWPERPESAALNNLRHTLTDLRHALQNSEVSPPYLLIDRETIAFNPRCCCKIDTWEFQRLLDVLSEYSLTGNQCEQILEKAVALYQGGFMENFMLGDCAEFEEWILARREKYSSQVLESLDFLTEAFLSRSQYKTAETFARKQLEIAAWREEGHRQLMKALALEGRCSEALVQYTRCQNHLAKDLGIEPGKETQQLYQRIRDEELPLDSQSDVY